MLLNQMLETLNLISLLDKPIKHKFANIKNALWSKTVLLIFDKVNMIVKNDNSLFLEMIDDLKNMNSAETCLKIVVVS